MTHTPSAEDFPTSVWRRSSHSSSGDGNDCVEIATAPGTVHVRDSKAPDGPRLTLTTAAWSRFVTCAGATAAP
ncbi:DUF397 domain-containing protein [Streptomyces glaucus]|uniref:DUF397 domain-containing protein n=1 Tax=Streptomyces glaucus TaxID=284029 RepID=A0ABP5XLT2_9ACTN